MTQPRALQHVAGSGADAGPIDAHSARHECLQWPGDGAAADFNPWASVVMLASSGILAFGLALYLFSWDSKNNLRRGHSILALLAFVPYMVGILLL